MVTSVGFAIPSIPPRSQMIRRAVRTIYEQTHPVTQISIVIDHDRQGAGPTRNAAKNALATEWTCFMDDDDELFPHHVEHLLAIADETGADVVFPWFEVAGGTDPFPQLRGLDWSADAPHAFPITALVRTEVAQSLDFSEPGAHGEIQVAGEDFHWWIAIGQAGAKVVHTPEITWRWWHGYHNSAGLPTRW